MPTQKFVCDKCSTPYSSEKEASRCEKSHIDFEVVNLYYRGIDPGEPDALTLRFANGQDARYACLCHGNRTK